jgi:hypothetical protein
MALQALPEALPHSAASSVPLSITPSYEPEATSGIRLRQEGRGGAVAVAAGGPSLLLLLLLLLGACLAGAVLR